MKDVLISITGSQHAPGEPPVKNEDNTIQLVTDGQYQFGDESCWLSYRESPLTGMDGTTTTFHNRNTKYSWESGDGQLLDVDNEDWFRMITPSGTFYFSR